VVAAVVVAISTSPQIVKSVPTRSTMATVERLLSLRKNLLPQYPFGGPNRLEVAKDKFNWEISWPEYNPPCFTTKIVSSGEKEWCDPDISAQGFKPLWNQTETGINRKSFEGIYSIDDSGYPLNPVGRTGIRGRGCLGKWGPNHAVDPIVTRYT